MNLKYKTLNVTLTTFVLNLPFSFKVEVEYELDYPKVYLFPYVNIDKLISDFRSFLISHKVTLSDIEFSRLLNKTMTMIKPRISYDSQELIDIVLQHHLSQG